jgi:hypothetical protein
VTDIETKDGGSIFRVAYGSKAAYPNSTILGDFSNPYEKGVFPAKYECRLLV